MEAVTFLISAREVYFIFSPTERTSETENQPPPPLRPLRATIAPGKSPTRLLPWILSGVLNLSGTRTPDPIIREDSSVIEVSLSFEGPDVGSISALATILPTTTTSSWNMVIKSARSVEEREVLLSRRPDRKVPGDYNAGGQFRPYRQSFRPGLRKSRTHQR